MPKLETPYYHRVNGLLFLVDRPVIEEEFLEAVRNALAGLGVVPRSVEVMADGYSSDLGPPRQID
ncbi:hypothetical protein H6CHR_03194 [Variovorax sp. PBL-H6]|uniref:hypothetical protein n=1 Tax=Variovorax sp. PBL-H6 TaxID=434009 RepID=UPI001318A7E6|nr:hypothetical protein [Variovorax sp. PBL-H6]VTU29435.1 hypothetical protein H6CHR_03194 [Variovorax sp. PBL-H6]